MSFRHPATTDVAGQMIFLGTGTSVGVPMIGCDCSVCTSDDPRNNRLRCSVLFGLPAGNLLIDTTPDLRTQLLRERIGLVHAVAFTHEHADHLFGLDDLRLFQFYIGGPVPLYCEPRVEDRIRRSFDYAFAEPASPHAGSVPRLEIRTIGTEPFETLGAEVTPIRVEHGSLGVLGFRIGNVAYCTDVSRIPDASWPLLEGLDVLVLGALRYKPHLTHFSLQEAIDAGQRSGARRVLFTHMSHDLEHAATCEALPDHMSLAYDGLRVSLT
jgi:phosphoribosyl 1,2-cyclic phosphate phosphodiesterase